MSNIISKESGIVTQFLETLRRTITASISTSKVHSNKLVTRQRINLLLDEGSEFLEFSALAAFDQYNNQFPTSGC